MRYAQGRPRRDNIACPTPRGSGYACHVKVLWWALLVAALAAGVWLTTAARRTKTVLVGPPLPSTSGHLNAPCPPRFLPDDGACIPVPRALPSADEALP
jgi:hypothetical protein